MAISDEYVVARMDGEDQGRFSRLEEARVRAIRDGAWLQALALLEFVGADSGVVLERWSKLGYPDGDAGSAR